jgi:hypothetical protein
MPHKCTWGIIKKNQVFFIEFPADINIFDGEFNISFVLVYFS